MHELQLIELKQAKLKVFKKRWLVLVLLICLIFQMIFIYTNFGFLNNVLVLYFDTTYAAIDWLYLGWNIGTTVAALVTSWLATKEILTCRRSMIVASILQSINCLFVIIAFLQPELLFLFILGQVIGGISAAVLWPVSASLAQLWFPESQIGIATGMSMIGSASGGITAYLLPTHIMKYPNNVFTNSSNVTKSTSWMGYDKNTYQWLFVGLLMVSLVALCFLLTVIPERPVQPPSLTQHFKQVEENRTVVTLQTYVFEIKKLIFDNTFFAYAFSACMLYYFFVINDLSMEQIIAHLPAIGLISQEDTSAYALSLLSTGSLVGCIAGGVFIDKYKNYRLQSSLGAALGCLFALLLLLSVYFETLLGLCFSIFLEGVFTRIAYLSILDSLMQHTYPTDPVLVMSLFIFVQNTMAILFIEINRQITYHVGIYGGLGLVCVVLFLVVLLSLIFKPKIKRLSAENCFET